MIKKIFLTVLLTVVLTAVMQAQLKVGARAGFNMTNVWGDFEDTKMKAGFQVGMVADYAFSDAISIQPGLLFTTLGYKIDSSLLEETSKSTTSFNFNYIQIPINLHYKLDMGNMKLLLQVGTYLGYGISGKENSKHNGEKFGGKIEFGSGDDKLNAFDFGFGAGAGIQFSAMQAVLGYNMGFANLTNSNDMQMKNNGLSLTLTYLFGK